ncbi:hypothetical protein [Paenibacillus sp. FSL K6-2524]|uniref:hypothetical protein n=1 Tax=Paenibacillus sp. FSL K6-2524 TaxID=2954516 RepID=UPI0030FA0129
MNICITGNVLCSAYGDRFEDYEFSAEPELLRIDRDFKVLPKVRRTDRLSRICLYTVMGLLDKNTSLKDYLQRTGIVMSSKYGPYKVCKEYIETVKAEGYDMGSPTLFSATVANAGVGYICRALGLHGPMTTERGADGIVSAIQCIQSGKAEVAYSLAVDEITEVLTALTGQENIERFSEISNLLAIESEEHAVNRNAPILGYIYGVQTFAVKKNGDRLFKEQDFTACLKLVLEEWKEGFNMMDGDIAAVILSSRQGSDQWQLERDFFQSYLKEPFQTLSPKDFFGESFSSAFQNAMQFALLSSEVTSDGYLIVIDADFEESKVSLALLKGNPAREADV